ncbi:23S rRNA (pseudouridine(1915)-N(3))-methyltransferase RlmH [Sphingomonas sp. SUN039]|uniref:23S rRNA (pseudouridine(1915)-N(3))-methyltransferase RlmH n=1 Tax=Sphingomonas sp. SUN039 TaxID=2937787 RepID=UPI002164B3D1|nr:23S rRNA (pseudouridine(1915)-N(3))-methyltransferase RlmH [Sphingomonas sp. SUN039]UVO55352.1 23S rRNA (pseudouridine(1915)-N(3))-methyltransferase RlmH [Sphingomonas sp. SUN039]
MKLHIVARGRIGRGSEAELVARYEKRIVWPFAVTELPETGGRVAEPLNPCKTVALDEGGEAMTSVQFAKLLEGWRDSGVREARFLIGAADGLTAAERASADKVLSFGTATWPHLLVRAMLCEQLYRATTIIAGHPYHREG